METIRLAYVQSYGDEAEQKLSGQSINVDALRWLEKLVLIIAAPIDPAPP